MTLSHDSTEWDQALPRWNEVDLTGAEEMFPSLYQELRSLARIHLRQQYPKRLLQTTELVHEAYLRLARKKSLAVESRGHFLALAGRVMRWILVDMERNRQAAKRGAGVTLVQFTAAEKGLRSVEINVLALDEALDRLAKMDPQQSQIVELRYFAGLSIQDTSELLGLSTATVKRSWSSARAWLLREISTLGKAHGRRSMAADQANS